MNADDTSFGVAYRRSARAQTLRVAAGAPADMTRPAVIDSSLDWLITPTPEPRACWRKAWLRGVAIVQRRPLAALVSTVLLVGLVSYGSTGLRQFQPTHHRRAEAHLAAPQPPHIDAPFAPAALRPLTPDAAIAWNVAAPIATGPNPAAVAFVAPLSNQVDYQHSLQCLTMAIYYEAGNEPDSGQRAVAQVVLNRMRHIAYPHTVCGVVFQGAQKRGACQFTFACDGAMRRTPAVLSWRRAERVAMAALGGYVFTPVGLATHYHADYVVPYWAASLDKVSMIGAHIFYRWMGAWGRRGAFTAAYAGGEPAMPTLISTLPAPGSEAAVDLAPVAVGAADRPVIMAGTATSSTGEPLPEARVKRDVKAVGPQDRWIVPHAAEAVALPTEPGASARPVLGVDREPN